MIVWRRLVRFSIVGALGVAIQLASLWMLADVAHVHYLIATSAAVGLAVLHNFAWHWWWTWRDRTLNGGAAAPGAFVRFVAANGALSFVGNLGVVATLVAGAHLSPIAANGAAIVACGLLNFWLGDVVVFDAARLGAR